MDDARLRAGIGVIAREDLHCVWTHMVPASRVGAGIFYISVLTQTCGELAWRARIADSNQTRRRIEQRGVRKRPVRELFIGEARIFGVVEG